jgi:hypothetical protein
MSPLGDPEDISWTPKNMMTVKRVGLLANAKINPEIKGEDVQATCSG